MKKALLMAAAIVAAAPACAESWTEIFSNESRVHYVDQSTLRFVGKTWRLWMLEDFRNQDERGYLSEVSLLEIDCADERMRILQIVLYKGAMASGEANRDSEFSTRWRYYMPNTLGGALVASFCSAGK